jgi:hypothetical protein
MTKASLERGREIIEEISHLKYSMSNVHKIDLFDVNEQRACTRQANEFLCELSIQKKHELIDAINKKIVSLEAEFQKL